MRLENTLILVRHAKSSWSNPGLGDHDRPLNNRGLRDAPRMGERLVELGFVPRLIVSSSALRARTTAELIAAGIGYETDRIEIEGGLYGASPLTMLNTVSGWDDAMDCAMLIAHNPGITDLVNYLTDAGIDNVPTCGIAVIRGGQGGWAALSGGAAEILHFDFPKNVGHV
jgi:phosphohistidine phosphatase